MENSILRAKRFAEVFAQCGDCELAALLTGSSAAAAREEGIALLNNRQVKRRLDKLLQDKRTLYTAVRNGLERIAFSRCNDAVQLAFLQQDAITPGRIRQMDLSCVASIKRDKDGGVDIKLFDRERALEALMRLDESDASCGSAEDFLSALNSSTESRDDESEE